MLEGKLRTQVIIMLMPRQQDITQRIEGVASRPVGIFYDASWCARWDRVVPLDRWHEISERHLPHAFACCGSLDYFISEQLDSVQLLLDGPSDAWYVQEVPWTPNVDLAVQYQQVRLERRMFSFDDVFASAFVAGGEEFRQLLRCSAFRPVYQPQGGTQWRSETRSPGS